MARTPPIRVMLSSRSESRVFEGPERTRLADLRRALKRSLEVEPLFGQALFDVWIHEDAAAMPATQDAWEESLAQVRKADIVFVLYNGEAGWAVKQSDNGICHDELREALVSARGKVYLIKLAPVITPRKSVDKRFQRYVEQEKLFHGQIARDEKGLLYVCRHTLREAENLIRRAKGRHRIVETIAQENE